MLLRTTFLIIILCYLSSVNAMNPQRFGHCSALAGDTLYVYGGLSYQISKDVHTAGSIMTNFQKFDLKTKVWSTVDKASDQEPRARAFHTCHYNASEIILFGGGGAFICFFNLFLFFVGSGGPSAGGLIL